jgi:hypothetical protein
MLSISLSRSLTVALGFYLTACGEAPAAATATERAAIAGGEPSPESEDAIVKLRGFGTKSERTCTGTLIASNLLLTAQHCVVEQQSTGLSGYSCRPDGTLAPPDTGNGWLGEPFPPGNIAVFFGGNIRVRLDADANPVPDAVGAQVFGSGSSVICVDDIALVLLDRPLPAAGLPLRLERDVAVGEVVTAIGYGSTDKPVNTDRYRRDGLQVIAVGPDNTSEGPGAVTPRAFMTGAGPCVEDQGGPALSEETGAVAGVYARPLLGNDCFAPDQLNLFTKVAPYASLIREAFVAAGAVPVEETENANPAPSSGQSCAMGRPGPRQWPGTIAFATLAVVMAHLRKRRKAIS